MLVTSSWFILTQGPHLEVCLATGARAAKDGAGGQRPKWCKLDGFKPWFYIYFNIHLKSIFRTEMNRTYIFDVIDRHSVKSIELYEFQVFLEVETLTHSQLPHSQARSGVGRFEVPGQPMYILRPGASEDQARCWDRPLKPSPMRSSEAESHEDHDVFWPEKIVEFCRCFFTPRHLARATCKVKLAGLALDHGFVSGCPELESQFKKNSQLGSSEQSHLKKYDTPFHPRVHHHFPIFSLWNSSFLDIPWYPTLSDTLSFSSEITFEAPSKADLHRRDEQWWAVKIVFTKKDPFPPWILSAGPARSAAKVHLCIFSRYVEETLGTFWGRADIGFTQLGGWQIQQITQVERQRLNGEVFEGVRRRTRVCCGKSSSLWLPRCYKSTQGSFQKEGWQAEVLGLQAVWCITSRDLLLVMIHPPEIAGIRRWTLSRQSHWTHQENVGTFHPKTRVPISSSKKHVVRFGWKYEYAKIPMVYHHSPNQDCQFGV